MFDLKRVLEILAVSLIASAANAQDLRRDAPGPPLPRAVQLDLSKAFHTRSAWRLTVTEGAAVEDYGGNPAPGPLTLCLLNGASGPCVSAPVTPTVRVAKPGEPAWEPHYLLSASIVYPRGPKDSPLLLIQTGSLNSGDGDQLITTQLIAYDARHDGFRRVYERSTGRNNNQEVRFVSRGPLRGAVISATPQEHSPYGYWIVVDRLTERGEYRQSLRYPSATRYNDGNPLAVIDSEMPVIQQRLGLWKPGQPIPTPVGVGANTCPKPTLRRGELWCD